MLKRICSILIAAATGLLASVAVLAFAQHPAGVAWAAPDSRPLATVWTVGGACGPTIQACIDAASPGDEVHIPAGLYTESVTVAKSISVTGDLSSTTIIHALDNQRVMTITAASAYLADLTLTGGVFTTTDYVSNCGGDLQVKSAVAWLEDVTLSSGTATCGGGLGVMTASATLAGVDFISNSADIGGGVAVVGSNFISNLVMNSGSVEHNAARLVGGGVLLDHGQMTLAGGQVFSNSADIGGGIGQEYGPAAFTQTGGSVSDNLAQRYGGGIATAGALVTLAGGSVTSNTAQFGGGVASFSDGGSNQLILSGADVANNTASIEGGGVYLNGPASYFTYTAGSIEYNNAFLAGGLSQEGGQTWLLGGDIVHNKAPTAGGVAVLGPDGVFNQTGGQISFNTGGGMLIGNTGAITVTISEGLIFSNASSLGFGGISINRGTLFIIDSRIISNTGGGQAGALIQFDTGAPVSVTVANTCIAGNGPITSVVNASGPTIDARGNWWDASDGPSGVGPGSGDSVSSGVDFSGFLAAPPVPGCPAPTADLTVSPTGHGAGTVTSSPAGIDCGTDCSETFYQGTVVTLTATPAVGSTFAGWSGACSGTGSCTVTIAQSTQATATFTLNTNPLAVGLAGNGSGAVSSVPAGIDCGGTCNGTFDYGTVVTLTATPAVNSTFAGWSGACGGTGACVVTMTQPALVTATFTLNAYTLTVGQAGDGTGNVTSVPPGIDCGATCSASFAYGTIVSLTAQPVLSSTFDGWSGACIGIGTCAVSMTQPSAVTATFTFHSAYTVTVVKSGTGRGVVTSDPSGIRCGKTCAASFAPGTALTLTADPAKHSSFAGWSGVCTGTGDCELVVTQDVTMTATFDEVPIHLPLATQGPVPAGYPFNPPRGDWHTPDALVPERRQ